MEPIRRANLVPLQVRATETPRNTLRVRLIYAPKPDARITMAAEVLDWSLN
jgi:hypothetical protein